MSAPPPHAALEAFARTGRLGPVALGIARSAVRDALGPPDDGFADGPVEQSGIWKYGDVEVYFVGPAPDAAVWLIHFDYFNVPTGGRSLDLDPWVIRREMPLADLQAALRRAGIPADTRPDPWNPGCAAVSTPAGVRFIVGVDVDNPGLQIFGVCDRPPPPYQSPDSA